MDDVRTYVRTYARIQSDQRSKYRYVLSSTIQVAILVREKTTRKRESTGTTRAGAQDAMAAEMDGAGNAYIYMCVCVYVRF